MSERGSVPEIAMAPSTVQGLLDLARDLAELDDLSMILDRITGALTSVAGFECASLNLVTSTGDLRTVAVQGPPSAVDALLGLVRPRAEWDIVMAGGRPLGGVLFDDASRRSDRVTHRWMSDDDAWFSRHRDDPRAWRPDYLMFAPMHDADRVLIGVVCVDMPSSGLIPDETQAATLELLVRQAERAIVASQALARAALDEHTYSSLFESSRTAMAVCGSDGRFTRTNPRFRATFGPLPDTSALDQRVTATEAGTDGTAFQDVVHRCLTTSSDGGSLTLRVGSGPNAHWFAVTVRRVGPPPPRAICTFTDVTAERRLQAEYEHDSAHDPLTGALNRRGFSRAVDAFYASSPAPGVAVMSCDLDDFKSANDQHGHLFGDDVLIQVVEQLRRLTPPATVIARMGGDEFAVVKECSSQVEADETAATIVAGVTVPPPDGEGDPVRMSVGVSFGSPDPRSFPDLFRRADEALFDRKRRRAAGAARFADA